MALLANLIANTENRVFRTTFVRFPPTIGSATNDNGDGAKQELNAYSVAKIYHRRQ